MRVTAIGKMVPTKAHEKLWKEAKDAAGESYSKSDPAFWPTVVKIYLSKVKANGLTMPDVDISSPAVKDQLRRTRKKSSLEDKIAAAYKQVQLNEVFKALSSANVALQTARDAYASTINAGRVIELTANDSKVKWAETTTKIVKDISDIMDKGWSLYRRVGRYEQLPNTPELRGVKVNPTVTIAKVARAVLEAGED